MNEPILNNFLLFGVGFFLFLNHKSLLCCSVNWPGEWPCGYYFIFPHNDERVCAEFFLSINNLGDLVDGLFKVTSHKRISRGWLSVSLGKSGGNNLTTNCHRKRIFGLVIFLTVRLDTLWAELQERWSPSYPTDSRSMCRISRLDRAGNDKLDCPCPSRRTGGCNSNGTAKGTLHLPIVQSMTT